VHDRDKTGKTRVRCSAVRESGTCTNRRIIYLRAIENAVLDGMREELKNPAAIEAYARRYNDERRRLASEANANRAKLETKRDRIEAERRRNIDMVIKGVIDEEDARVRIGDLKAQRLAIEAELNSIEGSPNIITLHPATINRYVELVDELATALADHAKAKDDRGDLFAKFRGLVHRVTVHPNGPRSGFDVEVEGKLAALIGGQVFPQRRYSGGCVVAEEGFEPPTQGL
jgi:site-specific DNA recombinase